MRIYLLSMFLVLILFIAGCTQGEQAKGTNQTAKNSCQPCASPSEWSECFDGQQKRTNYRCDSTTDFECKTYVESRSCSVAPVKKNETVETPKPEQGVKEFNITAKQFEFNPSTITVMKGDKVKLRVKSIDLTHGFTIPDLSVNEQLSPNTTVEVEFTPNRAAVYSFRCNIFCGSGHAGMSGQIIVLDTSTQPSFTITSPKASDSVNEGNDVAVTLQVSNLIVKPAGSQNNNNEGHFHITLDSNQYVQVANTTYVFKNIGAGTHTVTVELMNNDHSSRTPAVKQSAAFEVKANQGCSFNNPSCTADYDCINNQCVLKSGCHYNNPPCQSGYTCQNNQCVYVSSGGGGGYY